MSGHFRFNSHFAMMLLFTALTSISRITSAQADFSYTPILTNANYNINVTAATEDMHQIKSYEKINNIWTPVYYNYTYQIDNCLGGNCSSNNYIKSDQHGANITQNFYGATSSLRAAVNNINFKIGNLTGNFINNKGSQAGAIINAKNNGSNVYNTIEIGDIRGDFINNSSNQAGGAIVNNADIFGSLPASTVSIKSITGNFLGNSSNWGGGAIYNYTNDVLKFAEIGDINANFIANRSYGMGGAIQNYGSIGNISGNFISNSGYDGGAIQTAYKMGSLTGDFLANTAEGSGGAVYISNNSSIGKITGDFIGNEAGLGGGAVYTTSTKYFTIEGNFINNQASYGGAIVNRNNAENSEYSQIYNSSFYNNTATREKAGGAIYNIGTLDIAASGYDSVFQGNTSGNVSNAIYTDNRKDTPSVLNLIATNGGNISFYDEINGDEGYKLNLLGDSSGNINFHANVNNADIIMGRENITRAVSEPVNVNFDNFTNLSNHNNSLKINNGILTVNDFALDQHHFRNLEFAGGEFHINNVNVDLENTVMGRFTADNYISGNGVVKVHNLNLKSDNDVFTTVDFAHTGFSHQVENNTSNADGPVYSYIVNYLPESGQFTFQRTVVNDAVKVPSYAAVAAVSVLSDEIYSRVLADADSYFDVDNTQKGIKPFVKTFGANDHTSLKHFTGGDSKFYGLIAGLETNPLAVGSGWKAVYNTYLAYAQGEHEYAADRIDQDSGYIGVGGIFYKDNFFIGSTVNVAVMENKSRDSGEKNKFTSYLGGIGLKAGYNYNLGKNYVLQPNLYGSYTYVKSNDYKTRKEAQVKFGDMHNYELAPGLKLSKKFATGLEVYAKGHYVFNFNEGQKARANGISVPELELKNYAEFGIGVEQNWKDNGTRMFVEVTRREGGREGWNGLAGIKWDF